jgi:hypothetical protein
VIGFWSSVPLQLTTKARTASDETSAATLIDDGIRFNGGGCRLGYDVEPDVAGRAVRMDLANDLGYLDSTGPQCGEERI